MQTVLHQITFGPFAFLRSGICRLRPVRALFDSQSQFIPYFQNVRLQSAHPMNRVVDLPVHVDFPILPVVSFAIGLVVVLDRGNGLHECRTQVSHLAACGMHVKDGFA